jgi:AraC family L-rhamnose operon transcriptional activator RhaR
MKNYRPILLQNLAVAVPGVRVRQLRLNQHTPEAVWSTHSHDHGQLLIYLSGRGRQKITEKMHECRPGTVVYLEPGAMHGFERQMVRPPLVLVIDVDLEITRSTPHPCAQMPDADLTKVRGSVTRLFQIRQVEHREASLLVGSIVLEILDRVLLAAGWIKPFNRYGDAKMMNTTRSVERMLERMGPEITMEAIAARSGYNMDHLNRRLKAECGLTLGQLRSRHRLQRAQRLIQQGLPLQTVGERVGILDNNYFSRWFRQQTGMTPTAWKKSPQMSVRF